MTKAVVATKTNRQKLELGKNGGTDAKCHYKKSKVANLVAVAYRHRQIVVVYFAQSVETDIMRRRFPSATRYREVV